MFNTPLSYTDFFGENRTKTLYFNLNETEVTMLQLSENGGLSTLYQTFLDAQDWASLTAAFEKVLLLAYGERQADGDIFMKSDEIRNRFKCSAAYNAMFQKLMNEPDFARKFFMGIMPPNVQAEYKKNPAVIDEKIAAITAGQQ